MERVRDQTAGLVVVVFDVVGFIVVKAQISNPVAWLQISIDLETRIIMPSIPNILAQNLAFNLLQ